MKILEKVRDYFIVCIIIGAYIYLLTYIGVK